MNPLSYVKKFVGKYFEEKEFIRGHLHHNGIHGIMHKSWGHVFNNYLSGDYVEFGVYQGASLTVSFIEYKKFKKWRDSQFTSDEAWRRKRANSIEMKDPVFHGLDTFEGMPENSESEKYFKVGDFVGDYDDVLRKCANVGLVAPKIKLYKGLFDDSAPDLEKNVDTIAICNIDCDLYASTKSALKIAGPRFQIGTVVLFDDYNTFNANRDKGERRALREFEQESGFLFEPWYSYAFSGQSFLIVGQNNS